MDDSLKEDQGGSITQNEETYLKGWTDVDVTNSEEPTEYPRLFQNDMLISKILGYLNPQDLFGCRFVCKVWNSEASKILRKRITLTLDFRYPYYLPSPPVFQGMSKFGRKLAIQLPERESRFKEPGSPPHNHVDEEARKWKPWIRRPIHQNMITQLTEFISFPNHFTSLFLNMTVSHATHVSILLLILENVSKTLKTLSVEIHSHFSHCSATCPPIIPTFTLNNLTSFSHFTPPKCNDEDDWAINGFDKFWDLPAIFSSLLPENVEKLCFNRRQFRYYCQDFLKTGKMLGMKELYLKGVSDHEFLHFLELEVSLKSLEVSRLFISKKGDEECVLDQLLQKQAGNLERLILSFSIWENRVIKINVLGFPKLKKLSLAYESGICGMGTTVWGRNGRVDYSVLFPVLTSLSVFPLETYGYDFSKKDGRFNEEGNCQGFFDCFFPENSTQVCETVTELKIPMLSTEEGLSGEYTLYEERLRTIAKMFPNACNPGWTEWRDFN